MAGLIAAVMSHISGAVNSCTTIATIDFYLPYINRQRLRGAGAVRFGRMTGVVILGLGIFWAAVLAGHTDKPVFLYLLDAYGYFTPGIATMFLLGILWKRTTNAGALAAGILTIPLSVVLQILLPDWAGLNRATIVFWACMSTAVVVSLLTKPRPVDEIEKPDLEQEEPAAASGTARADAGLRNPVIWWAIVTAAVLAFYIKYA